MIKKRICSVKHFERMLIYFKKTAIKQMLNNPHINIKYHDIINSFILTETLNDDKSSQIDDCLESLLKTFKHNPYKSHSGFQKKDLMYTINSFWVTYTYETYDNKRIKNNDYSNCYICFRIFMKIDSHRKKRVAIWKVKVNWL